MEKPRRPHGRTDNQRGAGDASQRRLHRGVQARGVAGDLRLWGRVHAPGDQVCPAEGQTGKWEATQINQRVLVFLALNTGML